MHNKEINKHRKIKLILKVIGILMILTGLVLIIIGSINYSSSFRNLDTQTSNLKPQKFFFLIFAGVPFLGFGGTILTFGFQREINTYQKNENIAILQDIAGKINEEIKERNKVTSVCETCKEANDVNNKFCHNCGNKL